MFYNVIQNPIKAIRHPALAYEFYVRNLIKVGGGIFSKKNLMLNHAKNTHKVQKWEFLDNESYNTLLKERLQGETPFFSCRYGATEIVSSFIAELVIKKINEGITESQIHKLKNSSGVFPETQEMYLLFAERYCEALEYADFNAYWGSIIMEEYLLKQHLPPNTKLMAMRALEPFQYENPWTSALKGKNILVVHPFEELIKEQYAKRKKLFSNDQILPEFNLKVVKAVQSSGDTVPEDYTSWSEALDDLYQRCRAQEYDVALLSCGSYAVPLGARLKKDGKKAIVLGGMLQLMFGIKGTRWEQSRPDIVALYNDSWVRADNNYKVAGAEKMVDGAAYW